IVPRSGSRESVQTINPVCPGPNGWNCARPAPRFETQTPLGTACVLQPRPTKSVPPWTSSDLTVVLNVLMFVQFCPWSRERYSLLAIPTYTRGGEPGTSSRGPANPLSGWVHVTPPFLVM